MDNAKLEEYEKQLAEIESKMTDEEIKKLSDEEIKAYMILVSQIKARIDFLKNL